MAKGCIPRKVHRTFDGREAEIRIAAEFLQNEGPLAARILLIHGPRGVGKTAFVWRVAHLVNSSDDGHFDKFKNLLWVDKTNFISFLAACSNIYDTSIEPDVEVINFNDDDIQSISRTYATKARAEKTEQVKQKQYIKRLLNESHYLLIVDDFDEEEPLTSVPDICEQLERLSEPPNKVIITARSAYEHEFDDLSLKKLAIGLLSKQELAENARNSLKGSAYRDDIESIIEYLWKKTGGLAEFTNKFIIPTIEGEKYILDDKRLEQDFDKFVESYLLDREQPRNLNGYINSTGPREKTLDDVIKKMQPLARAILWSWINLDELLLDKDLSEKELGEQLGFFMEDGELRADFHLALQDLSYYRFILSRQSRYKEEYTKSKQSKTWVLIPIIQEYLKKHWAISEELMLVEEEHLLRFLDGYHKQDSGFLIIKKHLLRCCQVFEWFYNQKNLQIAQELGEIICASMLDNVSEEQIDDNLIGVVRRTTEILEQTNLCDTGTVAEKWLLLGILFFKSKQYEHAENCVIRARNLLTDSATAKWIFATTLLATLAIEKSDLETSANVLGEIVPGSIDISWTKTSYMLATKYAERGDYNSSFEWYASVIRSFSTHNDVEHVLKSCYQVAQLRLLTLNQEIDEIISLLKIGVKAAQEKNNQEKYPEDAAGTLCWYAAYLEMDGQKKQARSILEYVSSEICKPYLRSSPISFFIDERLIYMSQATFPTLVDGLKAIPIKGEVLLTSELQKIDSVIKLICPLCKKEIDKASDDIYTCQNCQTPYHLSHLKEIQAETCPFCKSPLGVLYEC